MRRLRSTILILVIIVSFFVAHGPFAVALSTSFQQQSQTRCSEQNSGCCADCCQGGSCHAGPLKGPADRDDVDRGASSETDDSSCPCPVPPCPIPGGCAYCNAAKVPCCPIALPVLSGSDLVHSLPPDLSISYVDPFVSGLIRPPIL